MKSIAKLVYFGVLFCLVVVQVAMGADLFVLFTLTAISCFAFFVFEVKAFLPADVIIINIILYSGYFTLIVKTLLGQSVDENLVSPIESSSVNLIGFLSIFCGYFFSRNMPKFVLGVRAPLLVPENLRFLALVVFPIGTMFDLLHIILRPQATQAAVDSGEGIGFFGSFIFVTTFGLVCQASYVFSRENRTQRGLGLLGVMLGVVMLTSVAANVKATFVANVIAVGLVVANSSVRINLLREMIIGSVVAVILVFYVSPAIHITRNMAAQLSVVERLEAAYDVIERAGFDPMLLEEQAQSVLETFASMRDPTLNYVFPSNANVSRFCFIQPVDQVVSRTSTYGILGFESLADVASSVLPSFLVAKSAGSSADFIAWHYRIRDPGVVGRPVIGLTASAFALGGYPAVILCPGLVIFLAFSILNGLTGPLRDNALGIFITSATLFLAEKEMSQIVIFFLRQLPIILVFLFIVKQIAPARGAPPAMAGRAE